MDVRVSTGGGDRAGVQEGGTAAGMQRGLQGDGDHRDKLLLRGGAIGYGWWRGGWFMTIEREARLRDRRAEAWPLGAIRGWSGRRKGPKGVEVRYGSWLVGQVPAAGCARAVTFKRRSHDEGS